MKRRPHKGHTRRRLGITLYTQRIINRYARRYRHLLRLQFLLDLEIMACMRVEGECASDLTPYVQRMLKETRKLRKRLVYEEKRRNDPTYPSEISKFESAPDHPSVYRNLLVT